MHFIQFNEANFEIIQNYLKNHPNKFTNLEKILDSKTFQKTNSENEYQLLEPWIQWPSIYTGLKAKDHNIFRLGDIEKNSELKNLFHDIDEEGITSGFICPMNLLNDFKYCHYFIPDPWTRTKVTGNLFHKSLYKTLSFSVNNNSSGKIGFKNLLVFAVSVIMYSKFKFWPNLIKLTYKALVKKQKWAKALFLDLFIHNFNLSLKNKYNPNISVVFFNSFAHIQHHYFLNSKFSTSLNKNPNWYIKSKDDPIYDAITIFDQIFKDYIDSNHKIFLATGLSQSPANKPVFYYRLNDHREFLNKFGILTGDIIPRMTRDFTINFKNKEEAKESEERLNNILLNGKSIFDIDNRGDSLFVILKYPDEITDKDYFNNESIKEKASENVSFVAIKNGIHNQTGYIFHNFNTQTDITIENIFQIKDFLIKHIPKNI